MIEKSKIDGVIICSPHSNHFNQTKMALEKGIDVLVEKPAVINYEEAVELKKVIEKTKRNVVVGYQRHYNPLIKSIANLIKSNKLGENTFLKWLYIKEMVSWMGMENNSGIFWEGLFDRYRKSFYCFNFVFNFSFTL